MKIHLVLPLKKHQNDIEAFLRACENNPSGEMAGTSQVENLPFDVWLTKVYNNLFQRDMEEGYVEASTFLIYADTQLVGFMNIRHCLNAFLEEAGGHIGYMIHPEHRRLGYAKAALKDALDFAQNALKLNKVLITCSKGNEASKRTILALNGKYENTVDNEVLGTVERYWIKLN